MPHIPRVSIFIDRPGNSANASSTNARWQHVVTRSSATGISETKPVSNACLTRRIAEALPNQPGRQIQNYSRGLCCSLSGLTVLLLSGIASRP
jgi:hypothetical protein